VWPNIFRKTILIVEVWISNLVLAFLYLNDYNKTKSTIFHDRYHLNNKTVGNWKIRSLKDSILVPALAETKQAAAETKQAAAETKQAAAPKRQRGGKFSLELFRYRHSPHHLIFLSSCSR
jgi:hypothetical protein